MAISKVSRSLGTALITAALAFGGAYDAYSQSTTGGGTTRGGTSSYHHHGSGGASATTSTPSDYATAAIVKNITAVRNECAGYDPVYRIDCLSQRLRDVSRRVPQGAAYGKARQIIARASRDLSRIQANNVDHRAPRQRSRVNPRLKAARTFSAIKRENLDRAMEQAKQVIAEAETQLLRATENSDKRASHYRQIAIALGSTKVLLRSA